jgi:predicted dehydrogenase
MDGFESSLVEKGPLKMSQLGFGVVGTGMIAAVVADAIEKSTKAKLAAVSSRSLDNAEKFVSKRPGATAAVAGVENLLKRADVGAVYVAAPTAAKEAIALAAIAAGKHVLVDKPFADAGSVLRMTKAADAAKVLFMDATHFVHHPRTAAIQTAIAEKIGTPRSLHTAFYAPITDRNNIRFDPKLEPMMALGDMAWYSMRAVVEYLRPRGRVTKAATAAQRDEKSGAVVQATGVIAFENGEVSTFNVGYTAGTTIMLLQLLGTTGAIEMDDFVLDWNGSFAFKNPEIEAGYFHRADKPTRKDLNFLHTPTKVAQEVLMIDRFAELAAAGNAKERAEYAEASLKTQEYLDAIWKAAQ